MPVKTGKDTKGCYAQWDSQKKYYYPCGNKAAMNRAKQKAHLQGVAAGVENEDVGTEIVFDFKDHDKHFEVTGQEKGARNKPGGSNVGKYKGVKRFCGPSGGAPAGTFPVNTRKRAIAALAYARNAPNPSGIRKCV